ncbi:hypothetical protein ABPG74_018173 [Tetrahymena malaccensis]
MNIKSLNLIFYLLVIQFQRIISQIQYIQSDRAQILYVNAITKTIDQNNTETNTYYYAKPFSNIPKVILSVQSFNFGSMGTNQQFKLSLVSTDLNSVTIQVQSVEDSVILDLLIGILAVDYPCVNVFRNIVNVSKPTSVHTIEQNIQNYIAFFTSFQGEITSQIQFDFNYTQIDNHTINIQAANFQGVNSIDYNLIVFYCDVNIFKESSLYEFQTKSFQNVIKGRTKVNTQLQTPSTGFYGLISMNLYNFVRTFSIFFQPTNKTLPISNGQYDFSTEIVKQNNRTGQSVTYLNSQVFDLLKLVCPVNQYFYNKSCILPTQEGVYCQSNPNICYDCDANCKTCQNQANQCLSCQESQYLFESKCYDVQQDGTYCLNNVCYRCSQQCKECQNNSNFCTQCHDFEYLFNNSCYIQKPQQAYCKLRKDKVI